MNPNRAKNCRQPARAISFPGRGCALLPEEYDNGVFSASQRFTRQVRSNIIVALGAELVIANKAVNELANAGGLPGHRMQQRQGLNLAC